MFFLTENLPVVESYKMSEAKNVWIARYWVMNFAQKQRAIFSLPTDGVFEEKFYENTKAKRSMEKG